MTHKEIVSAYRAWHGADPTRDKNLFDAFAAGVAFATRPRVTAEETPKEGQQVLAMWPRGEPTLAFYLNDYGWRLVHVGGWLEDSELPHWWPLPEVK